MGSRDNEGLSHKGGVDTPKRATLLNLVYLDLDSHFHPRPPPKGKASTNKLIRSA